MKKLGKKVTLERETIQAYSDCACGCLCDCSCFFSASKSESLLSLRPIDGSSQFSSDANNLGMLEYAYDNMSVL